MAHRDRRVLPEEQQRERLPGDVAAPDDHRPAALDRHLVAVEQLQHGQRSRGRERRQAEVEAAGVLRIDAIHVLRRVDRRDHRRLVEIRGERELHEDPGHGRVGVQLLDLTDGLLRRRALGDLHNA